MKNYGVLFPNPGFCELITYDGVENTPKMCQVICSLLMLNFLRKAPLKGGEMQKSEFAKIRKMQKSENNNICCTFYDQN